MYTSAFKKLFVDFIVVLPFVLFLFFRLDGIFTDMSNSDAARWHRRSIHFMEALKHKDFGSTYQSYHPGVTLMWLTSGVEMGIKSYSYIKNIDFKTIENTDGYLLLSGVSKIVLVFVLFSLLLVQFKFIDILFDRSVAVFYTFLLSVEPFMIGINRWYHLTSLEVFLCFTAFLALLIWADARQRNYLNLSAILFGLAVLTKFSTILVLPVFIFIFVYTSYKDKVSLMSDYLKDLIKFHFIFVLTIVILFPALWVSPLAVFSKILLAASNAGVGDYVSVIFAEKHPAVYYLVALAFKLSPITLVIFILSLFKTFIWRERLLAYNVVYIVFCLVTLSFAEQKIERYLLMLLPPLFLLCAVTLSRIGPSLQYPLIISSLVFLFLIFRTSHPIYSNYYSPAFGGPLKAYKLGLYDDNGEYFASAALFLNTLGRDVHVFVPNNVESFKYYFKGKIDLTLEPTTDFMLVSNDSRRETITMGFNCPKLVKSYYDYNFEAAKIYACVPMAIEQFPFPSLPTN